MKKAAEISFSGIACALSFVLLYIGSAIWILAYTAPIACGIIMAFQNRTFGKKYALCVFFATGLLSLLFVPDKEAALVYIFFFGYYPIIKETLEKIRPRLISYIVKLIIFNAGITVSQLLLVYVFGIPLENDFGKWGIPLFFILFNLLFISYECLYSAMLKLYEVKIEKRINNLLNQP